MMQETPTPTQKTPTPLPSSSSSTLHIPPYRLLCDLKTIWANDLFNHVIPFWETYSLDREHGGYFTCLDNQGNVYDETKYVWLQGREVWMFSHLFIESLGVAKSEGSVWTNLVGEADRARWLECATLGIDFLRKAKDERGMIWFSLSRDGVQKLHYQRKPYTAVFYVLAHIEYAHAMMLSRDLQISLASQPTLAPDKYAKEGVDMFQQIREWISNPILCGCVDYTTPNTTKLADVMCVGILAMQLMYRISDSLANRIALDKQEILDAISNTLETVEKHFDASRNVFLENASATGIDLSSPSGRLFCPGHSIETAWVVLQMCTFSNNPSHYRQIALAALKGSLERGWDVKCGGGLVYMMDVLGKPFSDATVNKNAKLWWPHCEALVACTMAYALEPSEYWLQWIVVIHTYAYNHFAHVTPTPTQSSSATATSATSSKIPREWYGYCDRDGSVLHDYVGGNYKGFFHVPRALWMCVNEMEAVTAGLAASSQNLLDDSMEAESGFVLQSRAVEHHGMLQLGDSLAEACRRSWTSISQNIAVVSSDIAVLSKDVAKDVSKAAEESGFKDGVKELSTSIAETGVTSQLSGMFQRANSALSIAASRAAASIDSITTPRSTTAVPIPIPTNSTQKQQHTTTRLNATDDEASNDSSEALPLQGTFLESSSPPRSPLKHAPTTTTTSRPLSRKQFVVDLPLGVVGGQNVLVATPEGHRLMLQVPNHLDVSSIVAGNNTTTSVSAAMTNRSLLVDYVVHENNTIHVTQIRKK